MLKSFRNKDWICSWWKVDMIVFSSHLIILLEMNMFSKWMKIIELTNNNQLIFIIYHILANQIEKALQKIIIVFNKIKKKYKDFMS